MKIEAGRAITEAMVQQRERDFLSLVVFDTIVGGWNRMSAKLAAKGWITPYDHASTIDEAMAQNQEVIEQLDDWPKTAFHGSLGPGPLDGGTLDLGLGYADKMFEKRDLSPEDQDRIAELLDPDKPWKPPSE